MIDCKSAISAILANTDEGNTLQVQLDDAFYYVLAEDIISPVDLPSFVQSAMDGYAISEPNHSKYTLVSEIKAGDQFSGSLSGNQTARVFTGAMIPGGTYAVIRQEDVEVLDQQILIRENIPENHNIRNKGEQVKRGETALRSGTLLNAGTIGFLSSIGIDNVKVYSRPKITIITTGSELTVVGQELLPGQIYESNAAMLRAALKNEYINAKTYVVKDDPELTRNALQTAIDSSDIVLVTGGVSVGKYDLVATALENIGVKKIFHRVAQKPGKPIYFGKTNNSLVFGLPGNPAAALSCFYLYVIPAIRQSQCRADKELIRSRARVTNDYMKQSDLTYFLKGYLKKGNVDILPRQNSAMLSDFISTNCLVKLGGGEHLWQKGDFVEIILLPD